MSGMAEVLMKAMDCEVREDSPDCTHDGYCSGHGNITYCTEHDSDEWIDWEAGGLCKYAASLTAALTAAGFGPVKEAGAAEVTEAQWKEAAEMAEEFFDVDFGKPSPVTVAPTYTDTDLREAKAAALEEAADDASKAAPNDPTNRAAAEWLRARATKIRKP